MKRFSRVLNFLAFLLVFLLVARFWKFRTEQQETIPIAAGLQQLFTLERIIGIMRTRGVERWTGLVMVGDGLAGLIWPREYLRKLEIGPQPVNDMLEAFAKRPVLTRTLCVMEVAFGIWIFRRQTA